MNINQFLRLSYVAIEEHGEDACWPWPRGDNGRYGKCRFRQRDDYAHRVAWSVANGREVPADRLVCHSCDNPICFNPAHLWLGTDLDNMRDMWAKGRARPVPQQTHCKRGHEYTEANTRVRRMKDRTARGWHWARECRQCVREAARRSNRKWWAKHGKAWSAARRASERRLRELDRRKKAEASGCSRQDQ